MWLPVSKLGMQERRYCSHSRGTASEQVIEVLERMPEERLNQVEEVILDMADSIRKIVCQCHKYSLNLRKQKIKKLILLFFKKIYIFVPNLLNFN
jgi:uncharacterized protein (DUF2384 family)